jgi:oxygen-independent coproporphyrinogen-3 oxidase
MYEVTQEICDKAGLPAYEISNHAEAGLESIHNRIYWNYGDYAGIGPGAHGRLTLNGQRYATEAPLAPGKWLSQVNQIGSGEGVRAPLTLEDQTSEFLLMGLRLTDGIDLNRLPMGISDVLISNINSLVDLGMVDKTNSQLKATQRGRPILNSVLQKLLSD